VTVFSRRAVFLDRHATANAAARPTAVRRMIGPGQSTDRSSVV
jgi:hypothetical protein